MNNEDSNNHVSASAGNLLEEDQRDHAQDVRRRGEGPPVEDQFEDDDDDEEETYVDPQVILDCEMIDLNHPNFTSYTTPVLADAEALQLDGPMGANTHLKTFIAVIGPNMTTFGAFALGRAIHSTNIRSLGLTVPDEVETQAMAPYDVATTILKECIQKLTSVFLSFRLTDDDAVKMKDLLTATNSLTSMALNVSLLNSHTAPILAQGIRDSRITKIDMLRDRIVNLDEVMRALYLQGIQNSHIDTFSLFEVIGDVHVLATVLSPIRCLTIGHVELSIFDMQVLASGLSQAHHLEILMLWECALGDEHVRILASGLPSNRAMKRLELKANHMGDAGALALMENRSFATIAELDLEGNLLTAVGAQRLIQASWSTSGSLELRKLNLEMNPTIGYDGLLLIGRALIDSMLTELNLNQVATSIYYNAADDDERELAHVQQVKRSQATHALLEGVRHNFHLQVLNVEGLNLSWSAFEEMEFYLEMNRKFGRKILSMQHMIPLALWCVLLAKFSYDTSVVFCYLRELPVLVPGGCGVESAAKKRRL